jgi:hypothetical protein
LDPSRKNLKSNPKENKTMYSVIRVRCTKTGLRFLAVRVAELDKDGNERGDKTISKLISRYRSAIARGGSSATICEMRKYPLGESWVNDKDKEVPNWTFAILDTYPSKLEAEEAMVAQIAAYRNKILRMKLPEWAAETIVLTTDENSEEIEPKYWGRFAPKADEAVETELAE